MCLKEILLTLLVFIQCLPGGLSITDRNSQGSPRASPTRQRGQNLPHGPGRPLERPSTQLYRAKRPYSQVDAVNLPLSTGNWRPMHYTTLHSHSNPGNDPSQLQEDNRNLGSMQKNPQAGNEKFTRDMNGFTTRSTIEKQRKMITKNVSVKNQVNDKDLQEVASTILELNTKRGSASTENTETFIVNGNDFNGRNWSNLQIKTSDDVAKKVFISSHPFWRNLENATKIFDGRLVKRNDTNDGGLNEVMEVKLGKLLNEFESKLSRILEAAVNKTSDSRYGKFREDIGERFNGSKENLDDSTVIYGHTAIHSLTPAEQSNLAASVLGSSALIGPLHPDAGYSRPPIVARSNPASTGSLHYGERGDLTNRYQLQNDYGNASMQQSWIRSDRNEPNVDKTRNRGSRINPTSSGTKENNGNGVDPIRYQHQNVNKGVNLNQSWTKVSNSVDPSRYQHQTGQSNASLEQAWKRENRIDLTNHQQQNFFIDASLGQTWNKASNFEDARHQNRSADSNGIFVLSQKNLSTVDHTKHQYRNINSKEGLEQYGIRKVIVDYDRNRHQNENNKEKSDQNQTSASIFNSLTHQRQKDSSDSSSNIRNNYSEVDLATKERSMLITLKAQNKGLDTKVLRNDNGQKSGDQEFSEVTRDSLAFHSTERSVVIDPNVYKNTYEDQKGSKKYGSRLKPDDENGEILINRHFDRYLDKETISKLIPAKNILANMNKGGGNILREDEISLPKNKRDEFYIPKNKRDRRVIIESQFLNSGRKEIAEDLYKPEVSVFLDKEEMLRNQGGLFSLSSNRDFVRGEWGDSSGKYRVAKSVYPGESLIDYGSGFSVLSPGYNSLDHSPPDPYVALFLSHYGRYLPPSVGAPSRFRNLYSYLASNNIHNNKPFGSYKIYEDPDG